MVYFSGLLLWVMVGWIVCYKMEGGDAFVDWLNRDPTGVVGIVLMIAWPVFAYLIYKNNKNQ